MLSFGTRGGSLNPKTTWEELMKAEHLGVDFEECELRGVDRIGSEIIRKNIV